MDKVITMAEVERHKSSKSNWIVIHNVVYDVTKFMDEHPGGVETLLEVAGSNATQAFVDVGHSSDAWELLKKYKIGVITKEDSCITTCCMPQKKTSDPCGACGPSAPTIKEHRRDRLFELQKNRDGSYMQPGTRTTPRHIVVPIDKRRWLLLAGTLLLIGGIYYRSQKAV